MSHEASLGIRADLFDYDFKAGFPLRKTLIPVRSRPEENLLTIFKSRRQILKHYIVLDRLCFNVYSGYKLILNQYKFRYHFL